MTAAPSTSTSTAARFRRPPIPQAMDAAALENGEPQLFYLTVKVSRRLSYRMPFKSEKLANDFLRFQKAMRLI